MLKQTLAAAVLAVLTFGSTTQAQLSLTSSSLLYPIYTPPSPIQFDAKTRVLTIDGTKANDDCFIYVSYYGMQVNVTTGEQTSTEVFSPYEVKKIVFNGGSGDDSFQFSSTSYMKSLRSYYGMYDLVCDLNGGDGTDILSGGPLSDVLNGGADGCQDVLIGNDGGDLFIRSRTKTYTYYNGTWYPGYRYEYESIQDFDYYEGDMVMYEDQLEAQSSTGLSDSSLSSSTSSSTSLNTSLNTTTTTTTTNFTLSNTLYGF